MSDMAKGNRVGKIQLTHPDGSKTYIGGVFKYPTSFKGNAHIALSVFAEEGEGFEKIAQLVTESGRIIEIDGYVNISAKL